MQAPAFIILSLFLFFSLFLLPLLQFLRGWILVILFPLPYALLLLLLPPSCPLSAPHVPPFFPHAFFLPFTPFFLVSFSSFLLFQRYILSLFTRH